MVDGEYMILTDRSRCQTAGCLGYALNFDLLCPSCKQDRKDKRNARLRKLERKDTRTPAEQGYDKHWRKISKVYRMRRPLCELCKASMSKVVDHILPIKDGGGNEESNLQALCHKCHNSKTFKQNPSNKKRSDPNTVDVY